MFDNECIYDTFPLKFYTASQRFKNIDRKIAQVLSLITSPTRLHYERKVDLFTLKTILTLHPRVTFPLVSSAPVVSALKPRIDEQSVGKISNDPFEAANQLMKCDPQNEKYVTCCMLYREDVDHTDVNKAIGKLESKPITFLDFFKTLFQFDINKQPPAVVPGGDLPVHRRAICNVANTTAIAQAWARLDKKFDLMFRKCAFVHWYVGEGISPTKAT
jgi:tubulin alpha